MRWSSAGNERDISMGEFSWTEMVKKALVGVFMSGVAFGLIGGTALAVAYLHDLVDRKTEGLVTSTTLDARFKGLDERFKTLENTLSQQSKTWDARFNSLDQKFNLLYDLWKTMYTKSSSIYLAGVDDRRSEIDTTHDPISVDALVDVLQLKHVFVSEHNLASEDRFLATTADLYGDLPGARKKEIEAQLLGFYRDMQSKGAMKPVLLYRQKRE